MPDQMRWRCGDTNPVIAAVDRETVIEIGDLLWQDVDDAKPAAAQADQGSDTLNRKLFAESFLGVAMQRSRAGETAPIRVATTGVFAFECRSRSVELGGLISVDGNTAGDGLLNQQVTRCAYPQYAIGRVARREPGPTTTVLVDISSTVMTGGIK